ncbi:F-box only protein 33 [Callorhinchus milii]|uniref:F-box protein 33 n=2 Tax=Callorhinchus milii TaxID=7868 RepID=A0A4W3GIT1_CALMI|nr:F-box only protein 33 [Callorhinchus milii]|eukprot:gi/632951844/ref/XP_007891522.1/ PREDICTED: F-box only protein 33 [Callorhinchus milii]
MALCGGPAPAVALPCEVIVHIFSFLSPWDRLRASSVCTKWRECLFYPSLWPELRLRLRGCSGERCRLEFLMKKCGSFVRELRVEFESSESPLLGLGPGGDGGGGGNGGGGGGGDPGSEPLKTYMDEVLCVLRSVRSNRNLQRLSVFGDVYLQEQDDKQSHEIQQLIEEILGNSKHLKWLSLGFMLEILTPTTLAALPQSSANCIEHLSLLDINKTPVIEAIELERFLSLRSLALDFCDFTAEVTRVLANSNHVPLHRLSLVVHHLSTSNTHLLDNVPQDADWKMLTRHCANLHVYIMAFNVRNDILLRILKPSIPLERIHFDSSTNDISGAVVDLLASQYAKSLTHLLLIKDVEQGFPDLGSNRNEDPLVLLAWKCKKLCHLSIHGYTAWAHNLIAIARLRGRRLRVLEVTEESINFDQGVMPELDGDPVDTLIEEVSLGLGKQWHPVMNNEPLFVFSETTLYFHKEMQRFSEGI